MVQGRWRLPRVPDIAGSSLGHEKSEFKVEAEN